MLVETFGFIAILTIFLCNEKQKFVENLSVLQKYKSEKKKTAVK